MGRTETCPVFLGFPDLQLFNLHLPGRFRSTLPAFGTFCFEVLVVSWEPNLPNDQVQFIEGQFSFRRQRQVEEPEYVH